jgi:hypothetical protein
VTKRPGRGHPASREGRLVILNKIDGLWDDLRTAHEIEGKSRVRVRTQRAC